ncbi:MAG: hypothetical protein HYX60_07940 [Legionella longbeachae]|nr:hypothetical protein [Legionella longbeachae]
MYTRLKTELNDFLHPYGISGFRIFRDWILQESGINPEGSMCRFIYNDEDLSFRTDFLEENDVQHLLSWFKLIENNKNASLESSLVEKNQESNQQRIKMATLDGQLDIDRFCYHSIVNWLEIPLNETIIFEHLLPDFKVKLIETAKMNPEKLIPYQLASKNDMENINRLNEIEHKMDEHSSEIRGFTSQYDVLFKMLGINAIPDNQFFFIRESRILFRLEFSGLEPKEQEMIKLLNYFKSQGDSSACFDVIRQDKKHDIYEYAIPIDAIEDACHPQGYELPSGYERWLYGISVDGEVFVDKVLNEFKLASKMPSEKEIELVKPNQFEPEILSGYGEKNSPTLFNTNSAKTISSQKSESLMKFGYNN